MADVRISSQRLGEADNTAWFVSALRIAVNQSRLRLWASVFAVADVDEVFAPKFVCHKRRQYLGRLTQATRP
ncbi:jg5400 [Pararge aegeria aegeria]|uniref:Jg5400 protein n=1 Tax=Pararge aegeria aegeria TaxID=348720 RepID=A0A8S4S9X7_9NEOP|nr:jg5400 [Pararge aegeria aegeria]